MKYSEYYNLTLPERGDPLNVADLNGNTKEIDGELHRQSDQLEALLARTNSAALLLDDLTARIKALEDALFNNITGNPWSVRFENLTGLTVTGVYNAASRRIEC